MLAAALSGPALAGDPVIEFRPDDPEMNAAIEGARETLDNVLERFATGGIPKDALSLKVAIPKPGGGDERIFVGAVEQKGPTEFSGTIDNNPNSLPDLKLGDRYEFTHEQIVDWLFVMNGQMHGAYTLRVMLPHLPKDQAEGFRAMLAPLPN